MEMTGVKSLWAIALRQRFSVSNALRRCGFLGWSAPTASHKKKPKRLKSAPILPGFGLPVSSLRPNSKFLW